MHCLNSRVPAKRGTSPAALPRVQEAVGGIEAHLAVNARLIASFAGDFDSGVTISASESNILKLTVTENAITVTEAALALSGNHRLTRANPLERHFRDVLFGRFHTPPDDASPVTTGRIFPRLQPSHSP